MREGEEALSDKVQLEGILKKGYGISPKLVMQDPNLSIEAKAIYAYMASFAGNGVQAFPSISKACKDLNVSKNRFLKHRKQLIESGYITVKKERKEGKFDNNIYVINYTVASNHRHGKTPPRQNEATNNNSSFNNNSSLIGSSKGAENPFKFYEKNFGVLSPFIAENIEEWCEDLSDELVIEAMKLALKANKQFNYAEGIMRSWTHNNIKTLDDVRAAEAEFENKRSNKSKRKSVDEIDWDNL